MSPYVHKSAVFAELVDDTDIHYYWLNNNINC